MRLQLRTEWLNQAEHRPKDRLRLPDVRGDAARIASFLIVFFCLVLFPNQTVRASRQDSIDSNSVQADRVQAVIAPDLALRLALDRLKLEAQDFRSTGRLETLEPDFADRFEHELLPADVIKSILAVQDPNDVSVDGYIRWQLLSFKPNLSTVSSAEFKKFVHHLPGFIRHPAASEPLQAEYERMTKFTGRNPEARRQLRQKWEALQIQIRQFDVLTLPSVKFRDAVVKLLPETGTQRPIFLLYDLRDRIQAGLSTRAVKPRITHEFKERRLDETLSADQRWALIQQIEAMAADDAVNETRIISKIVFNASSPAEIRYSVLTVRSSDARKWTAYLNRIEP